MLTCKHCFISHRLQYFHAVVSFLQISSRIFSFAFVSVPLYGQHLAQTGQQHTLGTCNSLGNWLLHCHFPTPINKCFECKNLLEVSKCKSLLSKHKNRSTLKVQNYTFNFLNCTFKVRKYIFKVQRHAFNKQNCIFEVPRYSFEL